VGWRDPGRGRHLVAQQQGLIVSTQEIADFLAQQQQLTAAQPTLAIQVQQVEQVLGLTPEQFWAQQQADYATELPIGKMRVQYYAGLGSLSLDEKASKWEEHRRTLASDATVIITAPADVR